MTVVPKFRWPFKIYRGLILHARRFAFMYPLKEKYMNFDTLAWQNNSYRKKE